MLMGEIPETMTNLYSLSFLNLSQNHLEGKIPTGKQFNTFGNDSYMGNPGLYGCPLSKSCNKDEEQPGDSSTFHHKEEFGFGWKAVAIGYACGMVFGMLLGSIVFLIEKPQWIIKLVEDMKLDKPLPSFDMGLLLSSQRHGCGVLVECFRSSPLLWLKMM
ncbi:hypothetical protein VNO77_31550 [Canavalia gladiata]|uniref:Uncharacterized protein n=1 Tax=Canavalia gladiata TaxID=3824 RepID=A0AAN9Q404_CANGL